MEEMNIKIVEKYLEGVIKIMNLFHYNILIVIIIKTIVLKNSLYLTIMICIIKL